MKKNKVLVVAIAMSAGVSLLRAQEPVVMTINDRPVTKSEFEAVYRKNNGKEINNSSKSVKEYVDLFSLFKSKVFEAESLGLDTMSSFKNELAGYRRQLAAPYLTDKNTNESILKEAYERLKTEVKASHILVKVDENALPKDTLEAWTRINLIRNAALGKTPSAADISAYEKILKNSTGIANQLKSKDTSGYRSRLNSVKSLADLSKAAGDRFPLLAAKTSDDPSAAENKGDLSYFSALDMVYPFENAAYNTAVGEVSSVVRTRFGYHILKVYDKRDSRGCESADQIVGGPR